MKPPWLSHARLQPRQICCITIEQSFGQCFMTIYNSQLALLDFEQLFHNHCNITDCTAYKGVGGVGAWEAGDGLLRPIGPFGVAMSLSCHRWSPQNGSPPDHLWQIMLLWMVPPDQVRLPQMVPPDHLWRRKWSPVATDGPP